MKRFGEMNEGVGVGEEQGGNTARSSQGLRERKKEQTRSAIEKAILQLIIEKGYEEVTIDEVCERVDISRKTFFNYFPSKQAAAIGRSFIPSKDMFLRAIEKHPEENYIDVMVGCIEHGLISQDALPEIKALRKAAMLRSPQIYFRTSKSSLLLHPAIHDALEAYLQEHPDKRKMPTRSLQEECLIGTSAVICVMRSHVMLSSMSDESVRISYARTVVASYLS